MSYTINKTNGEVLVEVLDGTVDQTTTDLTLIGKNSSAYGEFLNENLIKLLENFSSDAQPTNPIMGQLWYDTTEGRIKVYDGNGFKVSGGTIVTGMIPSLTQGDLWIDSTRRQLYFNDGTETLLAGPIYSEQQGFSGFQVIELLDSYDIERTVLMLYLGNVLLGIFSTIQFVTKGPVAGYGDAGSVIKVGFNESSFTGLKFNALSSKSESLLAADGTLKVAEDFLVINENATTSGTLSIQNMSPLILGESQNLEFKIDGNSVKMNLTQQNQNFSINTYNINGIAPSIFVNAQNRRVGVFTDLPTTTLDVNGDAKIRGSLTVEGNMTVIKSSSLSVDDKNIELGKVVDIVNVSGTLETADILSTVTVTSTSGMIPGMALTRVSGTGDFGTSPKIYTVDSDTEISVLSSTANTPGSLIFTVSGASNDTASDAGIIVKAGTDVDKTFLWNKNFTSWSSSENLNIDSGRTYKIDGTVVLTQSSLGETVIAAPGLQTIGNLDLIRVGDIAIAAVGTNSYTISYVNDTQANGSIVLKPKGTYGTVSVSGATITNVQNPSNDTDAVNKLTLENTVKLAPLGFALDATVLSNSDISTILSKIFRISDHVEGTVCRVYCTNDQTVRTFTINTSQWIWISTQ